MAQQHDAVTSLCPTHRELARSPGWVFGPEAPYEISGVMPNVVFPCGCLVRGDELWMYYGAGDTCVCLAVAELSDVLCTLQECAGQD